MLDLGWFRERLFTGSVTVNAIGMAVVVGNGLLISQYPQSVLGMSAQATEALPSDSARIHA